MKALTVWQPWSSLIACGVKSIETRGWETKYRGPLAIHAAKRKPTGAEMKAVVADNPSAWNQWYAAGLVADDGTLDRMPYGAVVATCNLVDVVPIIEIPPYRPPGFFDRDRNGRYKNGLDALGAVAFELSLPSAYVCEGRGRELWFVERVGLDHSPHSIRAELPFGDFTPGRYAWILDNVVAFPEPILATGRQGLWNWTSDHVGATA